MTEAKTVNLQTADFTKAFDNQEDCNVKFIVDGKTIGAHRMVLQQHCPVLYDVAEIWTADKDPISIDKMSYDYFKALLRFMYGGEVPISNNSFIIFLTASKYFKMDVPEPLTIDNFTKSIAYQDVCLLMNEAVKVQSTDLQEKCCEVFTKNTGKLLEGGFNALVTLSQPALSALLDVDQTNVVEITLFYRIKRWMEQQCEDQGLAVNGKNMRQVIGETLYKIRFPTMNVQDFANSVTTIKGLLTDTEMFQVLQKITVFDNGDIECPFSDKHRCQINFFYKAFSDIDKLLKENILYNGESKEHCNVESALKFAKDQADGKEISKSVDSVRFILQCCADLANSCAMKFYTSTENQEIRDETYDEFLAWQDIVETKNLNEIMAKFMQLRMKMYKLYTWQ